MKAMGLGVLLEWLWNCPESCIVCIDVLAIPGREACKSTSEVPLSVLESETPDIDSADFCDGSNTDVEG